MMVKNKTIDKRWEIKINFFGCEYKIKIIKINQFSYFQIFKKNYLYVELKLLLLFIKIKWIIRE